jgi:hypothetical protein
MSINRTERSTMKNAFVTTALVLTAALSASSSFAAYSAPQTRLNNVATSSYFAPSAPSVLSRAEVKAAVISAQQARAGLSIKETSSHFPKPTPSLLSRAEVKADVLQAHKGGVTSAVDYRG